MSMNCTDWPGFGEPGLNEKDALSVEEACTLMTRVVLVEPELLDTVNVTE
jgi:hypothetical protein